MQSEARQTLREHPRGPRAWAAVVVLGLGIFVLITIEEAPIGVLTLMADDLGVSRGTAGLAVTVPGILAGLVSLVTPVLTRAWNRRTVLIAALASVVISCALTVLAPTFPLVVVARLFAGLAIGLYWAVLAVVAVRQVRPERVPLALSIVYGGVGGALVLGVPLVAWIGSHLGWRESFVAIGVLAILEGIAVLALVRPVDSGEPVSVQRMRAALAVPGVRYSLVFAGLIVVGHFISYGYVSPLLQGLAHVPVDAIGPMLLAFGIAGLAGNFAITPLLRRSPVTGVLVIALGTVVSVLLVLTVVRSAAVAAPVMVLWGTFAGAASVSIQAFVIRESGRHEEAATAMNSAVYNASIAIGAGIGGGIIDLAGLPWLLVATAVIVGLGAFACLRWMRVHGHVGASRPLAS